VWSAAVPAGSASRQLYVNGREMPIAQATPSQLGFSGGWRGSGTGYSLGSDTAAIAWFSGLTAAQIAQVEFDYPNGNGPWTESRCRVASLSGSTLIMDQPCWGDVTNRAFFSQASGGLPSMSTSMMPALIENARSLLLRPGQWFLDSGADRLFYWPLGGQRPAGLDVELPRLETLVQGAGTLANPLHDVTFSGLQFSYATWNDPSRVAGFADVQSNLRMTGATNQGMCMFSTPAGSCPWGLLTQPRANVAFSASNDITLTGDRFVDLGGAGLSIMYGSSHNLVQGNEFTAIASTAMLLGCTADPTPINPDVTHFPNYATTNPDDPQVIKQNCTPDASAVAGDTIGTNEIISHNTVSDNLIHNVGTDYTSASGITLLFSQHTTISHNDLYDLPYTGITAGVIQGHVDNSSHPYNSLNINADNTISDNLIHDYLLTRNDGGAIYIEGHQAAYTYQADGTTIDSAATLGHGMQATGNVTYNKVGSSPAYYDDAGSEWINWHGNVAFALNGNSSQGGCQPTGHLWISDNYFSSGTQDYGCGPPVDSNVNGTTSIPSSPGPGDIPANLLSSAGLTAPYRSISTTLGPKGYYVSQPTTASPAQVLIAGEGFDQDTPVYFGNHRASDVHTLSQGFLVATVPAGADSTDVTVGKLVAAPVITDPANGSIGLPASYPVHGTGVAGNTVTVSDNGTEVCLSSVGADSTWSCNVTGAAAGRHVLTAVQVDGTGATSKPSTVVFIVGPPPASDRLNDTDPSFTDSGFSYSAGRGLGDYQDDVHYATANGSTVSLTFIGTGIKVFGEQSTDQGNIGVSIDGGSQQVVSTVPSDGQRHTNVAVYSTNGLTLGVHTIVVTKLSGQYMTFDGVEIAYHGGTIPPSVTVTPASPFVQPGQSTGVDVTVTNTSTYTLNSARLNLQAGAGWQVAPATVALGTLAPGATTTTHATVSAPTSNGSTAITATVTYTVAGFPYSADGTAKVSVPFADLADSFDNAGITDDTNTNAGDVDGSQSSYSAQALASVGITPGGTVTHGDSTFTWPAAATGQPDNTVASGQAITINRTGSTLGFLVTSTYGASSGQATVLYTDGSTHTFTLSAPDWYGTPPAGSDPAITAPYRNRPNNTQDHTPVNIYYQNETLDPTKTVADLILPDVSIGATAGIPALHVFAISLD
jgi:hypothetical protein